MEGAGDAKKTDTKIENPRRKRWSRFIRYVKRKAHERRSKKQRESSADRAARRTANATVWMAIFTVVLSFVSVGTLLVLKRQLKEMHEGGVDTHALAEAAKQQSCAAKSFASSAASIDAGVHDAVWQLRGQVKTSGQLAAVTKQMYEAETGAVIKLGDIALRRMEKDKAFNVNVYFTNGGKFSPDSVHYESKVLEHLPTLRQRDSMEWNTLDSADLQKLAPGYVAPKGEDPRVSIASYPIAFGIPPTQVYMWGKVSFNQGDPIPFCRAVTVDKFNKEAKQDKEGNTEYYLFTTDPRVDRCPKNFWRSKPN